MMNMEEASLKLSQPEPETTNQRTSCLLFCFICQQRAKQEMLMVVNYILDTMICICRSHLKLIDESQSPKLKP